MILAEPLTDDAKFAAVFCTASKTELVDMLLSSRPGQLLPPVSTTLALAYLRVSTQLGYHSSQSGQLHSNMRCDTEQQAIYAGPQAFLVNF